MTRDLGRMRAAMATLLVASALLFAVGILIERANGSAGTAQVEATSPPGQSTAPHVEGSSGEGETGGEAGESNAPQASVAATREAGEAAGHTETGSSEAILGIDPEAPPLVALAIILSLGAAFLVYRDGRTAVVAGAIAIAVGFAALDLLEVSHQLRDSTALVAVIAAVVAAGHLLAAWFGATIVRHPRPV